MIFMMFCPISYRQLQKMVHDIKKNETGIMSKFKKHVCVSPFSLGLCSGYPLLFNFNLNSYLHATNQP
uniref:Uncharacterized protein n=1 Tax=Terrapene triunguis TaxID=2587831 RepID=A0A674JHN2_9SAUR